ncbi:MAG: type I DNA topoisomerase [Vicinamibacterales bacterium]
MPKPLVIVESPAKARTLSRFLGADYRVEASYGHIRDLPESASEVPAAIKAKPWGRLGVDTEGDFTPHYVVPADKKKHVQGLRDAVKDASEVILATDPDREGESISWHLKQLLKPKVPVRRIVFHEITEEAIKGALDDAHEDVNENLVRAQESRRILDRLYGYTLSPVLWKKVQTGLSAGRVQSVAVRLIVEREEERLAFVSANFWDLEATVRSGDGREFPATLVRVDDRRVATGKDFDARGQLTSAAVARLDEPAATALVDGLKRGMPWRVSSVDEKPATQRPAAPFTTSTLQQEANRKLGFSSDRTMNVAQRLFQGIDIGGGDLEGLISYHRTDSTTLSDKALGEAGAAVREMYGQDYYRGPRQYQTKVRNAQEAHEAIRPTDFRRTPQSLERVLESDELKLYELIWKRAVASQMADAQLLRTSVEIESRTPEGRMAIFAASGKAIEFAGYLRAYVEGSDDPSAELGEQETLLPKLTVGDAVHAPDRLDQALYLAALAAKGHDTSPPARFTEASLVKRLEEEGIGRPSTYAPTVATIQRRGYVTRQGKALVPSFTAFAVTRLLREHFADYVDIGFTAEMEEILDEISNGQKDWLDFITSFYRGDGKHTGLETIVERKEQAIDYPMIDLGEDPESGRQVRVRIGRYGPFLQLGESGDDAPRASIPEEIGPADLTLDEALKLLRAKAEGPKSLGADPKSGLPVYVMHGRFGPYVQLGENPEKGSKEKPKRASLERGMSEDGVTLAEALRLLSLPRELGVADTGEAILANRGRFGPYVQQGSEFRSLEADDDVYTVSLERARELLAKPKGQRRQRAAATELRALGAHPTGGAPVRILDGRYGPYVTDGTTNASLPKGTAPEAVTMAQAVELLAARAASAPAGRRRGAARGRAAKAPAGAAKTGAKRPRKT